MSKSSRWVEAGDRRDGVTLRTPRLDVWSWGFAAVGSTLTCIPFVQLALLARIPLLFDAEAEAPRPSPWARRVALLGGIAALVPIGAPLVATADPHPMRPIWPLIGIGLALVSTLGHAALAGQLSRLDAGSAVRRWSAVALSAVRLPVALGLLSLALAPAVGPIPAEDALPKPTLALAALTWLDLGLGALAATSIVTLVRSAGSLRLPSAAAFEDAKERWWRRLDGDPDFQADRNAGGFIAVGAVNGRPVAIDVLTTAEPTRMTVRVTLPDDPRLAALKVVGRGDEEADVPLPDPILQRMLRVSGVSAEDAADLLADLHKPLFEVLRAHEDSRIGGGCVVSVAEAEPTDADALSVDAVLGPAMALAEALAEAALGHPGTDASLGSGVTD